MATLVTRDASGVLKAGEGETELVERRTRSAKVFHLGGRRYRIGASMGPVHYRLDPFDPGEELKEIDLDVRLTPQAEWDAACETNGYQVRLWQSREIGGRTVRYIAQFRRAGHWLAMAPLVLLYQNEAGEKQVVSTVRAVGAPVIDNERNAVTWADAFGEGIDFSYNLRPDRFFKTLIVREAAALPRPTIDTKGLRLVLVMALAWDAQPANGFAAAAVPGEISDDIVGIDTPDEVTAEADFSFRDVLSRDVWWLRKPMAWDSNEEEEGPRRLGVDWSLRRIGGRVFATFSVPASALAQATYPVYIDVAISEGQVGASEDDGYSRGQVHPGSEYVYLAQYVSYFGVVLSGSYQYFYISGFRFQTVPIPEGATVESASITGASYGNLSNPLDVRIAAEDVDDAAALDLAGHTPADAYASKTSASARWQVSAAWTGGTWYETPDLAAVIQEIIDRGGWAESSDLLLMIYNTSTSRPSEHMRRAFYTYDYTGNVMGAKFNCTYTEPATGDGLLLGGD